MRFLNSHSTGYEYFKDSSIVYVDMVCFDLTVACSNKTRSKTIIRRWRNPGFSPSVESFEKIFA